MERRRMPSKNGTNRIHALSILIASPNWLEVVSAVAVRSLFATEHIASSGEAMPVAPPIASL
eukprot:12123994-Karenia_brevis.AAC.1